MAQQIENKNIIKLNTKLSSHSIDHIKSMWTAARNCYYRGDFCDLEKTFDSDKAINLLTRITRKGHLSILEQSFFQFQVTGISRSCLAQLTRHRIGWTFAVQSQHYQKHDDFSYKELEEYTSPALKEEYYELMNKINNFYKKCLEHKIPRYIAREVLPNSTSVHLVASANLASLKHFWELRTGPENTPEIRLLSYNIYINVIKKFPEISTILNTNYKDPKCH